MPFETIANDYGLIGKVAIVSGAGGPIGQGLDEGVTNGRATAILLARAGARVCVVGRTPELAQHTVDIIKNEGGEAFAQVADVTREADCRGVVEATMQRYGRLDCLDNNVGRSAPGDVTVMSLEEWRSMFALNVDSMMLMCKYAIPAMVASGDGGSIVNIGSLRSIRPLKSTVYTVTKGAVIALTSTLAVDHGAQGIAQTASFSAPCSLPTSTGISPRSAARCAPRPPSSSAKAPAGIRPSSPVFFFPTRRSSLPDRASASTAARP